MNYEHIRSSLYGIAHRAVEFTKDHFKRDTYPTVPDWGQHFMRDIDRMADDILKELAHPMAKDRDEIALPGSPKRVPRRAGKAKARR